MEALNQGGCGEPPDQVSAGRSLPRGMRAGPGADEIVIEKSKGKIALLILGSLAFVAVGAGLMTQGGLSIAIGLLGVVFFGACGVAGIYLLFDKRPGLGLSPAGLVDNSSVYGTFFIPWHEISDLSIFQVQKTRLLVVHMHEPQRFNPGDSWLRRKAAQANISLCGSPLAISSNSLKLSFDELQDLVGAYYQRYGLATAPAP